MKHYGDVTKINGADVEPVNVIIGGSPCQDLSVAGKQKGLQGERSGLFMEQLRVIKEMRRADRERGRQGKDTRPRYMVWENVPGAFSSNKGEDFGIVLQETIKVACEQAPAVPIPKNGWPPAGCLTDVAGQWSLAWRVFDAQFWGVPQRRKRIALIADFGGTTAPEILFERQGVPGYLTPCGKQGQGAPGNIETSVDTASPTGGAYCIQGNCIDRADTAGCNGKGWTEGVSYTLNTIDRPAVLPFVPAPHLTGGANPDNLPIRSGTDNEQNPPQPNDEHREMPHTPQPGCSGDSAMLIFEPGSCTRVGRHIWADGKAPSLKADAGDNRPAVALEHHPNDSRLKIAEDGMVQTLNARMGTGGGQCSPHNGGATEMMMFENYQFANWRPGCGTLKASGGDYGGGLGKLDCVRILER